MEETKKDNSKHSGIVKWFDEKRGFGFIVGDDGKEYFCHYSSIISEETYKTLRESSKVEFKIEKDSEKGDRAIAVKKIE